MSDSAKISKPSAFKNSVLAGARTVSNMITPVDSSTHADGWMFVCLIFFVIITLFTVGVMTIWSKIAKKAAAAQANVRLIEECREEYNEELKNLKGLTIFLTVLCSLLFLVAIIFLVKAYRSTYQFKTLGWLMFFISLTILVSNLVSLGALLYKKDTICTTTTPSVVAYNSSLAVLIVASLGTLVAAFGMNSEARTEAAFIALSKKINARLANKQQTA